MLCPCDTHNLFYTNSSNFGDTWETPTPSQLSGSPSTIDILKTTNNRVFLARNSNAGCWMLYMSELVEKDPQLKTSWGSTLILENSFSNADKYTSPSIIECNDPDKLFVAYSKNRSEIMLAKIAICS